MSTPAVDAPTLGADPQRSSGGSLLRRLTVCFILGGVLLAGKRWLAPANAAAPVLVVEVAAGADAEAVRRASIEAVLIDEALRAGWPIADPVVRERLHEVGRTDGARPAPDLAALTRIDPATRARLVWIGRELVRARIAPRAPSPLEHAAYRTAHPHRYAPGWLSFHQLTISRARHGARAEADARALLAQLTNLGTGSYVVSPRTLVGSHTCDPGTCPHLVSGGDPTMLPARMAATPASIDARFGVGFAKQVGEAPVGRWAGPYEGTFGFHVVWREAGVAPTSEEEESDEARVRRDWSHDQRERDLRGEIEKLVEKRRIVVREVAR